MLAVIAAFFAAISWGEGGRLGSISGDCAEHALSICFSKSASLAIVNNSPKLYRSGFIPVLPMRERTKILSSSLVVSLPRPTFSEGGSGPMGAKTPPPCSRTFL